MLQLNFIKINKIYMYFYVKHQVLTALAAVSIKLQLFISQFLNSTSLSYRISINQIKT